MFEIFVFIIFIYLFRIIGFGLTNQVFGKYFDRGYAFSGIIGLLIVSYFSWIVNYIFKIPINTISLIAYTSGFVAISTALILRKYKSKLSQLSRSAIIKNILKIDFIFIILFFGMLTYRFYSPSINNIEDVMDMAIINGLIRGEMMPPQDVWYSGQNINYYYFGHYIVAVIAKVSQIPSSILYNLFVAYTFAASGIAMFSIVYQLTKKYYIGLFSALLLVLGGNLSLLDHLVRSVDVEYFYANARSLIPNTINEFPAYSFMIGNLHAHILSIPFSLLVLALGLMLYQHQGNKNSFVKYFVTALALGSLIAINSWDFLIYSGFIGLIYVVKSIKNIKLLIASLIIPLSGFLLFYPYFNDFTTPTTGVGIVKESPGLVPLFIMFGYFFVLLITGYINIKSIHHKHTYLILTTVALGLFIFPLVFYIKDIYDELNPPFYRANTFFKFWFQSWIFFVVCSGMALAAFVNAIQSKKNLLFNIVIGILIFGLSIFVFAYPVNSYRYLFKNSPNAMTLNGYEYLKESDKGKYELIEWININLDGQPIILEAYGKSYRDFNLVSAYTGLPTVIGWYEHELGWRNNWPEISQRMGDVENIYTSMSTEEIKSLIEKHNVAYVLIGEKEREIFGPDAGAFIKTNLFPVVKYFDEELYRYRK